MKKVLGAVKRELLRHEAQGVIVCSGLLILILFIMANIG